MVDNVRTASIYYGQISYHSRTNCEDTVRLILTPSCTWQYIIRGTYSYYRFDGLYATSCNYINIHVSIAHVNWLAQSRYDNLCSATYPIVARCL